ncbi:hypothetical protein [Celeribacter persicus]|jgi:hypothetical protein|uniref:Response regulatory domain-containing protein n=1 Tax=Celeribacter persicus TaxID=1651082 RepID=A0A2T5HF48_9RHOB|nr:hypothetical protein [Celeribacter persicus]PTQ70214.1 hypothetical protein C8N42_11099 [Celeribacter persicus]
MFSHSATPAVQSEVFLIVAEEYALGESLHLALLRAVPGAEIYRVATPGEAIVTLSQLSHVTVAFLAMPAAEVNAGVLELRLLQRGARIVLLISVPPHIEPRYETLLWPQNLSALVAFLRPTASDQT